MESLFISVSLTKAEAKEEVIRKPKSKPKTNLEEQIQYFEPEEDSVFSNLTDRGGFKEEYEQDGE